MKTKALIVCTLMAFPVMPAAAQTGAPGGGPAAPAPNAALSGLRMLWNRVMDISVRAAEKMPEENFSFKPAPDIRSFGQLVGHAADANFMFAQMAAGEKPAPRDIEKTKTSKADLVAALKESYAACDKVFAKNDADLAVPMKFFGMDTNRFAIVGLMIGHNWEHYGNMVTYMRIKGIVPPSSEPRPDAPKPAAAPAK